MSLWQITERKALRRILHDFEQSTLSGMGSNFLGLYIDNEGPTGAEPQGLDSDPVCFGLLDADQFIEARMLSGRRLREVDLPLEIWCERPQLERVALDIWDQWLDHLNTLAETGWTFFPEDGEILPGVAYNAGLGGKTLRVPVKIGAQ